MTGQFLGLLEIFATDSTVLGCQKIEVSDPYVASQLTDLDGLLATVVTLLPCTLAPVLVKVT